MLRSRRGFTLIELLVAVTIISVLSLMAVQRFNTSRQKTFYAAMKSDLVNLVNAQEIYYSTHDYKYGGTVGAPADPTPGLDFKGSEGVFVTFRAIGQTGWSADATHGGLNPITQKCAIFFGAAPALTPAVTSGNVTCVGENW